MIGPQGLEIVEKQVWKYEETRHTTNRPSPKFWFKYLVSYGTVTIQTQEIQT